MVTEGSSADSAALKNLANPSKYPVPNASSAPLLQAESQGHSSQALPSRAASGLQGAASSSSPRSEQTSPHKLLENEQGILMEDGQLEVGFPVLTAVFP